MNMHNLQANHNFGNALFLKYNSDILETRKNLFSYLREFSPQSEKTAKSILKKKLNEYENVNIPRMFEIFPWFLNDIAKLEKPLIKNVSTNWLALYLYVTFLDECLDNKNYDTKPTDLLGASILAQTGLINLFKIVAGTKYEAIFTNALRVSAKNEFIDVIQQSNLSYKKSKLNSAKGKNAVLLVCAGAISALENNKSDLLIDLTKHLLLTFQLLDDFADLDTDYNNKNFTYILSISNFENQSKKTHFEILDKLVESQSLLRVLTKIEKEISNAMILLGEYNNALDSIGVKFIKLLHLEIIDFQCYLTSINEIYLKALTYDQKQSILDQIDGRMKRIYLHS